MNWLAHLFLSEPDVEFRLGNLFADIVRGADLLAMPSAFRRGAQCHRAIDAFTDRHPLTIASRSRIRPPYGRYSGILIDIFYDYFLAQSWKNYADTPLSAFTESFYAASAPYADALPGQARFVLQVMRTEDLLGSYARISGIETALRRISRRLSSRLSRTVELQGAVAELTASYDALAQNFAEFFPQLQEHAASFHQR
jgi:acyl carrier protein phosphodiesterase